MVDPVYDLLGKRYLELASLAAETFREPKTHVLDIRQNNGSQRLFHLDISYPMILTNHSEGYSHINKEIVLGFNDDFDANIIPAYRERIYRMLGAAIPVDRLKSGRLIAIRYPGKISYAKLFLVGENRFSVSWTYPDKEVQERQIWFYTGFKDGNLDFMFSETFDPGQLSQPRELDKNDPRNLQRILDECEPWLKEIVAERK